MCMITLIKHLKLFKKRICEKQSFTKTEAFVNEWEVIWKKEKRACGMLDQNMELHKQRHRGLKVNDIPWELDIQQSASLRCITRMAHKGRMTR